MANLVRKAFDRYDEKGLGTTSRSDIVDVLNHFLESDLVDALMKAAPMGSTSEIDYNLFIDWLFGVKLAQPKFVGGSAAHVKDDLGAVAKFVVDAMEDCGCDWFNTDPSTVSVKRCSGGGAFGVVYKVTAARCQPPVVALHVRWKESGHNKYDPLFEERYIAACDTLSAHGVAPQRLSEGDDWFVETWEGETIGHYGGGKLFEGTSPEEIGSLLARVHQIPCGWFDKFRQNIRNCRYGWSEVPDYSRYWHPPNWSSLNEQGGEAMAIASWFLPSTPAAARIVTCHGDFHTGNIVRCGSDLKVIDFEYTFAGIAILDHEYVYNFMLTDVDQQRRFASAYLRGLGERNNPEDVDTLVLDTQIYISAGRESWWSKCIEPGDAPLGKLELKLAAAYGKAYEDVVRNARSSCKERTQALSQGFAVYANSSSQIQEVRSNTYEELEALPWAEASESPAAHLVEIPAASVPQTPQHSLDLGVQCRQLSCTFWFHLHDVLQAPNLYIVCAAQVHSSKPFWGIGDFLICWTGEVQGASPGLSFIVGGNYGDDSSMHSQGRKYPYVIFKSSTGLADMTWHHIALVYDTGSKSCELFVDGAIAETYIFRKAWPPRLAKVSIGEQREACGGRVEAAWTRWPKKQLHDVRLLTRKISSEEVSEVFAATKQSLPKSRHAGELKLELGGELPVKDGDLWSLRLHSHPGKGIALDSFREFLFKKTSQNMQINSIRVGPIAAAVQLIGPPSSACLQLVDPPGLELSTLFGNAPEEGQRIAFVRADPPNQKVMFCIHADGTVSPVLAQHLTLGVRDTDIVLVKTGDPDQLVFGLRS